MDVLRLSQDAARYLHQHARRTIRPRLSCQLRPDATSLLHLLSQIVGIIVHIAGSDYVCHQHLSCFNPASIYLTSRALTVIMVLAMAKAVADVSSWNFMFDLVMDVC